MTGFPKLLCCAIALFVSAALSVSASQAGEEPAPAQSAQTPALASPPGGTKPPAPLTPLPEFGKPEPGPAYRIGYVDIARLGQDSLRGKTAQEQLKSKLEKLQSQVTTKQKQLDKQKNAIQEKLASLTPDQRTAKAREFEKKVAEFQKFVQKSEKDMLALQEELTRKLADEVKAAAETYGKENGYAAIVVSRDILYRNSDVATQDVTDELIKLVDATGK